MVKKTRSLAAHNGLTLKDLIDVGKWQTIQNDFSDVTNVSIRTVDADCKFLTLPSRIPRLCRQIITESPLKSKICGPCLPTFLGGKGVVNKNLSFSCDLGLCNFAAPLKTANNKTWGYVLAGPVILVQRKPKEEYAKIAEDLDMDLDKLWDALLEIKVVSFHGMKSILELIRDVGIYTIEMAYKSLHKKARVRFASGATKLKKITDTLLNAIFEITKADMGSVMFLDRKKELTIRASRNIADDIIKSTRVKVGEGISGLVAKSGESFLIDDNLQDSRIKPYLNRPQIASSMVLPFKIENKTIGVMNVGALRASPVRFTANNVGEINRLLDLASLAIGNLP
jgi:ligand-binding sensor protein